MGYLSIQNQFSFNPLKTKKVTQKLMKQVKQVNQL